MGIAACRVFDLRIAVVPVQIREHPTFSPFQIRSDALRNTAQLFRLTLFSSPSLVLLDPGVELKIWKFRFHGFVVLIRGFAFSALEGLVDTAAGRHNRSPPFNRDALIKALRRFQNDLAARMAALAQFMSTPGFGQGKDGFNNWLHFAMVD